MQLILLLKIVLCSKNRYHFFNVLYVYYFCSVIYYQDSLDSEEEPKVLIDPNQLSDDGTIALQSLQFNKDGSLLAYGVSESGSDWVKIKFRNLETNEDFPETLEYTKFFTPTWTKDNKGVFYGRFPAEDGKANGCETNANENQKVYYHRVGEAQDKDVLVAEFPEDPNWRFSADVSDCGNYLVLFVMKGCNDQLLYFSDLRKMPEINGKLDFTRIVEKFEADYDYITNEGDIFYFRTNNNAPNYRVIAIDFKNPAESNWKTLIEQHSRNVLDWVFCVNKNKLAVCYMEDVKSVLQIHSLESGKFEFKFPLEHGNVQGFFGDKDSSEIFYHFVSFLIPGLIYHYDFSLPSAVPTIFKEVKIENFDRDAFIVEQKFYPSKDGEKIPMFIVRKKQTEVQPRPCLLYGYGGFNISLLPSFSVTGLVFIDLFDGVLAYPNIRGGGEYGEKWHNAGRLLNKQNVFDDFQEAAEFLKSHKYTTKKQLAIQGGSNGGLLVGACINQRPDLFGGKFTIFTDVSDEVIKSSFTAAIAQVAVMDMLRFHKFTIGSAWISDFGDMSEKEHFENLLKYSPLHNVHTPENENEEYPATLVLTGDHDDRVSPLHSLKFVANLHHAVRGSKYQQNPILMRIYEKAGHGFGKPTAKRIEEATDILTFLYKSLECEQNL